MSRLLAITVVFPLLLTGCKGNLALIGLDGKHQPVSAFFDESHYQRHFLRGLRDTDESLVPMLERHAAKEKRWELQLVVVGLGIKAQAGIGPFQASIAPGIRAIFSNTDHPPPLP
jgi:hypothetical protein